MLAELMPRLKVRGFTEISDHKLTKQWN